DSARRIPVPPRAGYSELRVIDGSVYTWLVVPVVDGQDTVASIAHLRRISDNGNNALSRIIGPDSEVYYTSVGGGAWITLDGRVITPPAQTLADLPERYGRSSDGAIATARVGTPTIGRIGIVVETPLDTVLASPRSFLRQMIT